MKFFKCIFIFLFLFSCQPSENDQDSARDRRFGDRNLEDDKDRNRDNRSFDRSAELRRLRSDRSKVVTAVLDDRYEGIPYGDYAGRDCGEDRSCRDICDDLISHNRRKKCYNSPIDLVEDLEEALFTLISISDIDSVPISPSLMAGIFDIDESLLEYLVKRMSEGSLRSFLAWVAINRDISYVFLNKDRSSDILKKAFERLAESQDGVTRSKKMETALNMGLIQDEDSFFYLSAAEDNSEGFEIAYDLLKSACSDKDCKMTVLCAREIHSSSRSRTFGYQNTQTCRTSANQGRRASRGGACYIHSSVTWSFLEELIEEKDIRDTDFKNEPVTVEKCNDFCGSERTSKKCKRVL